MSFRVLRILVFGAACLVGVLTHPAESPQVDAAKKERQVVWYTTQIVDQLARPLAAAFERKYPGIEVRLVRANATDTALKILYESKAGKTQVDVFDGTTTVQPLKKEGYVLKWMPESAKNYPQRFKDPAGYWVATNIYIITPAYNTNLIPKGTAPRTFEALLDPKWRGQMAWGSSELSSAGPGFIGTVLSEMGEQKGIAYLRELQKQKIANLGVSARGVLDQVIAGEYAIALQIFNDHVLISAKKGAPVEWIRMEPATGVLSVVSIAQNAPHPNAAKLFEDFLVSEEGQKVYQAANYLPADPAVPALDPSLGPEGGKFRAIFFSPETVAEKMPQWKHIFDEMFQ